MEQVLVLNEVERKHPNCSKLPLIMFETYENEGDLQGMSAEHWETIKEEFATITGDTGMNDMLHSANRVSALSLKDHRIRQSIGVIGGIYTAMVKVLAPIEQLYHNAEAEATRDAARQEIETIKTATAEQLQPIIASLHKDTGKRNLTFSIDTLEQDLKMVNSYLKNLGKQLKDAMPEAGEDTQVGREKNTAQIDMALIHYQQAFGGSIADKNVISTQTFGIMLREYRKHCEAINNQNRANEARH